jgi:hypothetical protein
MPRGSHLKTGVTDRHRKVARGILLEGKSIRQAMLDAGYSQASANQGPQTVTVQHEVFVSGNEVATQAAEANPAAIQ